jgi:hypothetical protein
MILEMPPSSTALADAVSVLRRNAQAPTTHAHALGALETLLLALLASLFGRPDFARIAWHHPTDTHHPASTPTPIRGESRAENRLRAWVGWILRFFPGLGMAPSGRAPAPPSPTRTARAPPRPA